ncbi:MAG: ThiF family adenylyltransferase [Saprospiraceae bacterium]|nr:ThiF family adenylyltransferase [Saprospiraceae bacterium]
MKALINNNQLEVFSRSLNRLHQGVAFLEGEGDVIRAYVEYPSLPPMGKPFVLYFVNINEGFSDENLILEEIENDFANKQNMALDYYLAIICEHLPAREIAFHTFYKKDGQVTPCELNIDGELKYSFKIPSIALDTSLWKNKKITLVGLEGMGSMLARELASAGVKSLTLIDDSIVTPGNLHFLVAGVSDIGRLKSSVVHDVVMSAFPDVKIVIHRLNIVDNIDQLEQLMEGSDIIINLTNNFSTFNPVNKIAVKHSIPAIFIKFNQDASFGYLFRWQPSSPDAPCFDCLAEGSFISKEGIVRYVRANNTTPVVPPPPAPVISPENIFSTDLLPFVYMASRCVLQNLSEGRIKAMPTSYCDCPLFIYAVNSDNLIQNIDNIEYAKMWWFPIKIEKLPDCPTCASKIYTN